MSGVRIMKRGKYAIVLFSIGLYVCKNTKESITWFTVKKTPNGCYGSIFSISTDCKREHVVKMNSSNFN